jgi:hypothetical protein
MGRRFHEHDTRNVTNLTGVWNYKFMCDVVKREFNALRDK